MKITYSITACNEHEELKTLMKLVDKCMDLDDEIVVLVDSTTVTPEVLEVLGKYDEAPNVRYFKHPLEKDFARQKNFLTSKCTGDFIFNIDADEIPHEYLLDNIKEILATNPECDVYWVPRINTVDGLTEEHIKKWHWNVNDKGWVNFPDPQMRIYRNDPSRIKWIKPVHEVLTGFKGFAQLPAEEEYSFYHPKTIDRQERQNNFYETIQ